MLGSSKRIIALAAAILLVALIPVLAVPVEKALTPSHHTNANAVSKSSHDGAVASIDAHDRLLSPVQDYRNTHGTEPVGRPSVDQLEERQVAQVAKAVIKGVEKIVSLIKNIIAKVKARRAKKKAEKECIKDWVDEGQKAHPDWNWLVVHTGKARFNWKAGLNQGTDYDHVVNTCALPGGGQATYDVYSGPHLQGDFYNDGGRGNTDVSFSGNAHADHKGKHVAFT